MSFVGQMLDQGFRLMRLDGLLWSSHGYIANSLRLAVWATAIALVLGLPVAFWAVTGDTRARRLVRTLANAGLGLPPVGVGVYLYLVGPLSLYGTFHGMVVVQTILSLPIVVALCATAMLRLAGGLVEQARAFGAGGWRLAAFMVREAKVGIVAAVIVSMGAAIGEVGAVTIIHGSETTSPDQTLSMQILWDAQHRTDGVAWAVAHAIAIVGVILVLGVLLTLVQQSHRWRMPGWRRAVDRLAALAPAFDRPPRSRGPWPRWARALVGLVPVAVAVVLVGDAYRWSSPAANGPFAHAFTDGLRFGADRVASGEPGLLRVTLTTLQVAFTSTAIAAIVGLPLGAALGIGRFRGRRALLVVANGLTRVPPVAVGVVVLVLFTRGSIWGGGPLAGVPGDTPLLNTREMAQTLLALPIVTALTAAAVQGVAPALIEQARALGAPGWRRGVLALREARRAVLAGVIVALGVTISAVGALAIAGAGLQSQTTLALEALNAVQMDSTGGFNPISIAVGDATMLLLLFGVIAAVLTWLQREAPGRPATTAGVMR